jgi:Undecaprenyl-phosphate glucose phosphotransferase
VRNDEVGSLPSGTGARARPEETAASLGRSAGGISPRMMTDAVMILDAAVVVGCSILAHLGYAVLYLKLHPAIWGNAGLGLISALLTVIALVRAKSYEFDNLIDFVGQIGRVLSAWVVGVLVLVALGVLLKVAEDYSRGWLLVSFVLTPTMLLAERSLVAALLLRWTEQGYLRRNVAIVGAGPLSERLCSYIESRGPRMGLRVIGIFDDRRTRVRDKVSSIPVLGTVQDLISYARNYRLDEVIIALPWSAETRVASLVEELSTLPADIRLCPDLVGLRFLDRPYSRMGEIGLLHVNQRPIAEWSLILKTVQDYVVAALALVLGAPLMLFIAIAIKLDSPGPVFFKQRRRGFNQNMFPVWKFRTMRVMEDGQAVRQAQKNDDRITRVGRFLRRASLDELPQFFNVLQGSMSVVGPRPHAVAHDDYYSSLISRYARRHRVKPGLTGWAQIHGFRGETDTVEKMAKRIEYDLYYIEHWSFWLDFKILLLTFFKGFWHHNAY